MFNPDFMYRLDPLGNVRSGFQTLDVWDASKAHRWNRESDNAVDTVGYWDTARPFLEGERERYVDNIFRSGSQ